MNKFNVFLFNGILNRKILVLFMIIITGLTIIGTPASASSVILTSITLDPEDSYGATTNAPGAWSTNQGDPLSQIGVKDNNGVFLNVVPGALGEISIPLEYGTNTFTLVGSRLFPGNPYYGAVLFFDGVATPPQVAVYNSNGNPGNFLVQPAGTMIMGSANGGLFFDISPGSSVYVAPDGTKVEVVKFVINSMIGTTDEISWGNIGSDGFPDTTAELILEVTPPYVIAQANVQIEPDTLNLKSKGEWITTYIEFPEIYDVNNIVVSTVILKTPSGDVPVDPNAPVVVGDYDSDGVSDLMVKFDRSIVVGQVCSNDVVDDRTGIDQQFEFKVVGQLVDETQFEGTDTVMVIKKGK